MVGIIAILAIMILIYLRTQVYKARDAKRKADMHLIKNAVEEYEKDHDCYPPEANLKCDTVTFSVIGDGLSPYLSKIPCDPISGQSYLYEPGGPTNCFNWYRLYALLDNGEVTVLAPGGVGYDYYVSSPNAPTPVPVIVSTPTPRPTFTPTPTLTPTPSPSPIPSPETGPFWGCFNGNCLFLSGPPYCNPKFGSGTCYGLCRETITGDPINECL